MKIHQYQGKKFCKNDSNLVEDNLTVEEGLQIYINNKTFSITMRTPGDDEDLVRGLLYAEDIYRGKQVLSVILEKDEKNAVSKAFVEIDENQLGNGYKNSRNLLSVSSCGICGRQAAFAKDSTLLSLKEDVGRHNAVDKVIGNLVATNQLRQSKCMVVSGRISYEIVAKAYAAKIPVLGAVSAPSSLAVDFAKELGITLLGFCRENKATCYAHPQRIKE